MGLKGCARDQNCAKKKKRVLVLKIAFLETHAEEHLAVTPGCRPRIMAVYFLPPHAHRQTDDTQTTAAIGNDPICTRICTYPFFEVTPPGAAPGPPVKTGSVFVASGGVIIK